MSLEEKKIRLEKVRAQIKEACLQAGRNPSDVKLLAVSKTKPAEDILDFLSLGVTAFGENYIQEGLEKIAKVGDAKVAGNLRAGDAPSHGAPEWHMIGHLQSNKAKFIPGNFSLLHGLDSLNLADKLNKAGAEKKCKVNALIEVNMNDQNSKAGITPAEAGAFLSSLAKFEWLSILGLMCIPDPDHVDTKSGKVFADLRSLLENLNSQNIYPSPLRELSMGMSADFPLAVREGATIVRVGTALFGERN